MELFNGSFYDGALTVCFTILGVHLVLISIFAVYQTIRDKALSNVPKDSPKYWRVPEAQLLLISALGGSVRHPGDYGRAGNPRRIYCLAALFLILSQKHISIIIRTNRVL